MKRVLLTISLAALVAGLVSAANPVEAAEAAGDTTAQADERPDLPPEEEMGLPGNWEVRDGYTVDSEEVRVYAQVVGIEPAAALEVLEFQNAASDWLGEIEATIGLDRFAVAEFIPGRAELVIHVTSTSDSDDPLFERIAEALPSGVVRIEADAVYSLSQRWDMQNASDEPINVSVLTGEIRPYTPPVEAAAGCQTLYGRATDGGRLVRWDNSYPYDKVRSDPYNGYTDCEPIPTGNAIRCTNAFSVTKNGWEGYLTAAHCGNKSGDPPVSTETSTHIWSEMYAYDMRLAYAQHRFYVAQEDNDADAQMNREVWGSTALNNQIYLDEERGFQSITSVQNGAPAMNAWLCVKNAMPPSMPFPGWSLNDDTAGAWCGIVDDPTDPMKNGQSWASINTVDWYKNNNRYHTDGGSGGPVYSGAKAYGMITHSQDLVGTTAGISYYGGAFFMHASAIEDELGCSIYTG